MELALTPVVAAAMYPGDLVPRPLAPPTRGALPTTSMSVATCTLRQRPERPFAWRAWVLATHSPGWELRLRVPAAAMWWRRHRRSRHGGRHRGRGRPHGIHSRALSSPRVTCPTVAATGWRRLTNRLCHHWVLRHPPLGDSGGSEEMRQGRWRACQQNDSTRTGLPYRRIGSRHHRRRAGMGGYIGEVSRSACHPFTRCFLTCSHCPTRRRTQAPIARTGATGHTGMQRRRQGQTQHQWQQRRRLAAAPPVVAAAALTAARCCCPQKPWETSAGGGAVLEVASLPAFSPTPQCSPGSVTTAGGQFQTCTVVGTRHEILVNLPCTLIERCVAAAAATTTTRRWYPIGRLGTLASPYPFSNRCSSDQAASTGAAATPYEKWGCEAPRRR